MHSAHVIKAQVHHLLFLHILFDLQNGAPSKSNTTKGMNRSWRNCMVWYPPIVKRGNQKSTHL